MMPGKIFIATETFASAHAHNMIRKGVTRVREGHALLGHHPMFFKQLAGPQDDHVDYEVETRQPTTPAQVREPEPAAPAVALMPAVEGGDELDVMTRRQLEAKAEELGIDGAAGMANKAELIAAIRAAQ